MSGRWLGGLGFGRLLRMDRRAVASGLLVVVGLALFGSYAGVERHYRRLSRMEEDRIGASERLLSALKDVETGERGYVITGLDQYLEPYRSGLAAIPPNLETLTRTGTGARLLPDAVSTRLAVAAEVVKARAQSGNEAARLLVEKGDDKAAMDRVRDVVQAIQDRAMARNVLRDREETLWGALLATLAIAATLLGFLGVVLLAWRRRRSDLAARAMLAGVLENAPVGLGLLDGKVRLQHMNRALAGMSERALGAEEGASLWDALPELRETLEPRLNQVLATGRGVRDVEVSAESTRHPGLIREFQIGFFPVARMNGQAGTDGAGLVVTDVTLRNRSERRVRESEERFRQLTTSNASIVWVTNPRGEFEVAQPGWTAFTGQDTEELTGRGWIKMVHPDDLPRAAEDWRQARTSLTPFQTEYRLRHASGGWRTVSVFGIPVLNEDGSVREWVGMHTDITEQREAEIALRAAKEEAEAANRAKSTFLANMSHELRTPLSAVIGYSEMLEEEMQGQPSSRGMLGDLQKINANARHLLSLINDVLDLSKIEAEKMTTYAEDFTVERLMTDVQSTVQALVGKKGNRLVLDVGGDGAAALGAMHTDQVKLRQCLFNLIGNAAKFTEDGTITVRVRREGDMVSFAVQDSGIGMTAAELSGLFERFQQADASTTRKFGGTGLGLAITRAFCHLLGGEVTVESVAGAGSTFTIAIPAVLPEDAAEEPEETRPGRAGAAGQPRHVVLVIDDDPAQRDLLSRFLEREGFDVRTASDGRVGLEMARSLVPRAILLDVMMPQMDGWSVLTALKADPAVALVPVVMVTFVNDPAMGASLGAAELISKPVDWERLKHVMERYQGDGEILVVDDDADARARVRSVLEQQGLAVAEAENGKAALEAVERSVPRLILLDLTMPVMDGFTFLHELRRRPGCADVPVLVLTARDLSAGDRKRLDTAERVLSKGETSLRELAGEVLALAGPATDGVKL